jgi:hypothetical protein
MAEIILDDTKICIPNRLKIATFISEIQKKTKQIIYLINEKEVGVFQSLGEVKRGMWRRLKPSDSIAHYYIDPETQNEYTVFSSECANKLGNFPYEGPTNINQNQERSAAYQQSIQTIRPPIRQGQPPVENLQGYPSLQQTIQQGHPSLQQPITAQPLSYQNGQSSQTTQGFVGGSNGSFPSYPFMNVGYQKYTEPPPQTNPQPRMSSKTLQNINRIAAFQRQQMGGSGYDDSKGPKPPIMNQWFSNLDTNTQEKFQNLFSTNNHYQNNLTTYPQNYSYPPPVSSTITQPSYQSVLPNNFQPQPNIQSTQGFQPQPNQGFQPQTQFQPQPNIQSNQSFQPQTQFQPQQSTQGFNKPQSSYVPPHVMSVYASSIPEDETIRRTSFPRGQGAQGQGTQGQGAQGGQGQVDKDGFRYFPPGRPKKSVQNVAPQTVESKFTA